MIVIFDKKLGIVDDFFISIGQMVFKLDDFSLIKFRQIDYCYVKLQKMISKV